ncbi:MAG TPA: alpha/beta hydrolase [Acidimicrobiia bacterium]|nr:alpha/beta hydrolase [Acidimicrobiia bacterium]
MEPRVLIYNEAGEGNPLVLVPGGLTGWLSWIPHQERLSTNHRVVRVQPIHNELGSDGKPGDPGYTAEVERDSLLLTLDQMGVEAADFAGWSGGGRALIEFAVAYPDRVRSLTLVEPAAYWILEQLGEEDVAVEELNRFIHGLAGKDVTEDDLANFLVHAGFVEDFAQARLQPNWERWTSHRMALSWQDSVESSGRSLEDLSSITCPVLLVKGTVSVDWERRVVDVLGESLPNARVVELAGDHACHIQSIDRFLEELEAHLH